MGADELRAERDSFELETLRSGDPALIASLLDGHRARLRRLVKLRLDPRIAARVDASDVIQDTLVEVARRLPEYIADPDMPPFLWLRFLVVQKLSDMHRRHLGAAARDAGREEHELARVGPDASTPSLASLLVGQLDSPSQGAVRRERQERVRAGLESLPPMDREVLALRHFEQLSNGEVAELLGLEVSTASRRYLRALTRLRAALADLDASGASAAEGA